MGFKALIRPHPDEKQPELEEQPQVKAEQFQPLEQPCCPLPDMVAIPPNEVVLCAGILWLTGLVTGAMLYRSFSRLA